MFVFQLVSDEMAKAEFLRVLCRNVANNMFWQDLERYLVHMRPDDLGLAPSDLAVNKTYRSLHRVKKAFSFNKTPTTSRLTRAVSSMISPLTANSINRPHQQHPSHLPQHQEYQEDSRCRDRLVSTPSGDLQNLRLQSCSNLLASATAESPITTRSRAAAQGVTPSRSERYVLFLFF